MLLSSGKCQHKLVVLSRQLLLGSKLHLPRQEIHKSPKSVLIAWEGGEVSGRGGWGLFLILMFIMRWLGMHGVLFCMRTLVPRYCNVQSNVKSGYYSLVYATAALTINNWCKRMAVVDPEFPRRGAPTPKVVVQIYWIYFGHLFPKTAYFFFKNWTEWGTCP